MCQGFLCNKFNFILWLFSAFEHFNGMHFLSDNFIIIIIKWVDRGQLPIISLPVNTQEAGDTPWYTLIWFICCCEVCLWLGFFLGPNSTNHCRSTRRSNTQAHWAEYQRIDDYPLWLLTQIPYRCFCIRTGQSSWTIFISYWLRFEHDGNFLTVNPRS